MTSEAMTAIDAELAAARTRGAQRINLLRSLLVSIFLGMAVVLGLMLGSPRWQASFPLLALYASLAWGAYAGGWRWQGLARIASLAIPLLDMPMVFLLRWQALASVPDPLATVALTTAIYVGLLYVGALSLDRRRNVVNLATAAAFQTLLLAIARADAALTLSSLALLGLSAWLCDYARVRILELVRNVVAEHERRAHLSRYFSPEVVAAIESPELERSHRAEVTVLFSDLRDFTALSEQLDDQEVVDLLAVYHERMVEEIFANEGVLDKFLGDGIMAWFGPLADAENHGERAVRCSIAMHEALMRLNQERAASGATPLRMGVGIHTGSVILGSVGAARRREYTAIGDTVNVAARIEALTRQVRAPILVSESTRELAAGELRFSSKGAFPIVGKSEPIRVFAPITETAIESGPA
jgi:adenylate cyclase